MHQDRGFTMIEILVVIAIIAILAAIAVPGYHYYLNRAAAAELMEVYDTVRLDMAVNLENGLVEKCDELRSRKIQDDLHSDYAKLTVNFYTVKSGGYSPYLTVCAGPVEGRLGVEAARETYKVLGQDKTLPTKPVLLDGLVVFSLPIADTNTAACRRSPSHVEAVCRALPKPSALKAGN